MTPKVYVGKEVDARNGFEGKIVEGKKKESYIEKIKKFFCLCWKTLSKSGRDDPNRVIHSVKIGLSLTLVSLLYLVEPLFKGIGSNAIWAVMTVVVVMEFTAGATLCKGINRALGTVLAASLAFLIQYVANEAGRMFQAAFVGIALFVVGAAFTYIRFVPYMKKNYDYGVMIFILTFNLITVTSYRKDHVVDLAKERIYNIAIGCAVCLFMTLFVFPNWSGETLHNNTIGKLEGLARSVEACVNEYFREDTNAEDEESNLSEDPIYDGYKSVLDSKSTDETLALHASWEPRRTRGCYKMPWNQYVKVGAVLRRFGYSVVALHGCLQTEIQTPQSVRALFKDPCTRLAKEVSNALIELANSISNRRHVSPEILSDNLQEALFDLNVAIKSQPRLFLGNKKNHSNDLLALAISQAHQKKEKDSRESPRSGPINKSASQELKSRVGTPRFNDPERKLLRLQSSKNVITSLEFSEALPFAAFASLLVEIVAKLDDVIAEVEQLGKVAQFKEYNRDDKIVITCERSSVRVDDHVPTAGGE